MKSQTLYLSCIFLWLMLFQEPCSCSKTTTCFKEYQFTFPVSIQPTQDTLNIGDTIWVGMEIPAEIINEVDSEMVFFINPVNFDFKFSLSRIDTVLIDYYGDSIRPSAINNFSIINVEGETDVIVPSSNPSISYLDVTPVTIGEIVQRIKFGLIPGQIGVYKIGFFNLSRSFENIESFEGDECESIVRDINFNLNNSLDNNNYDLFLYYTPSGSKWWYDFDVHLDEGKYVFVVR